MMKQGIMSCYPLDEQAVKGWPRFFIQPKLDGDRSLAQIDSQGKVVLFSSEGRIITSVPHINEALQSLGLRDITLDGELYIHGRPHEYIHGIVSRKNNLHPDYQEMEYHIFDLVSGAPQSARFRALKTVLDLIKEAAPLKRVRTFQCTKLADIFRYYQEFMAQGYEGYILRHSDMPYISDRSPYLMKFKPMKDDVYPIVDVQEEISQSGQPKNRLGALICRTGDNNSFKVGTGFSKKQREKLWKSKFSLLGKCARVAYQCATAARGVPRFPVFVEIVGDEVNDSYGYGYAMS